MKERRFQEKRGPAHRRERASLSRAEPSATITKASGIPSTRCARSTRTWSSSMADRPRARNALRPAGPIIARSQQVVFEPNRPRIKNAAPVQAQRSHARGDDQSHGEFSRPGQRRHRRTSPTRQKSSASRLCASKEAALSAAASVMATTPVADDPHGWLPGSSSAGLQQLDFGIPAVPVLEAAPLEAASLTVISPNKLTSARVRAAIR